MMEAKKTILVLEDNVMMNKNLKDLLKERTELSDYLIKSVHRIDLAREFFDEHKNEICCIITDLNMNDEWLDDEWIEETNGGIFSGWVWLQHCVYSRDTISTDIPEYNGIPDIPTIICSGYIDILEDGLKKCGKILNLKKDNVYVVNKGAGAEMGFKQIFEYLKEILHI